MKLDSFTSTFFQGKLYKPVFIYMLLLVNFDIYKYSETIVSPYIVWYFMLFPYAKVAKKTLHSKLHIDQAKTGF